MDALLHDFRSAVRSLTNARGFTAVAILVFALGIGINTALFSLSNALFFRPLPVDRPEQIVYLYDVRPEPRGDMYGGIQPRLIEYLREDLGGTFSGITTHLPVFHRLTIDSQTELTRGEIVSSGYFQLLGVTPQLGRALTPADHDPATPVYALVISDRLWQRRFNRDPAVIGRRVRVCCRNPVEASDVDRQSDFEIVGVMRPSFGGVMAPGSPAEFWASASWLGPGEANLRSGILPIARLAEGVSVAQAQSAVRQRGDVLLRDEPAWPGRRFEAHAAADIFDPRSPRNAYLQRQMTALTVVVAIVLLIAASNVAGLLIARGANRTSETAVRVVMGASRLRIVRLLLTESLLLAGAGGALGLVAAYWLLRLYHAYAPAQSVIETPLDARVLAFTAALCIGVGLTSGLTPALRAARINLLGVLPGSALALTPVKRTRTRLRHFVLIPQVALSLALLVIAGFHVRSLLVTELADPGYDTADRVVLTVGMQPARGERQVADARGRSARRSRDLYRGLMSRLRDLPGAPAVALAAALPLNATMAGDPPLAIAEERAAEGARGAVPALGGHVSPGYFRAMGIRMLSGRDFDDREMRLEGPNGSTIVPAPLAAIVSESVAQTLWQGRNPLGRRVAWTRMSGDAKQPIEWLEVIGVVEDVHPVIESDVQIPRIYVALGQQWAPFTTTVIAHVPGTPPSVTTALARAVTGAHPLAEVSEVRTLDQMVAQILSQKRTTTGILAMAGLVGLLLAVVGLYGVISYSVARRIRELGVRCALGATRADIIGLVMREGAVVTTIGLVSGGWLAYAALRAGMNTPIRTDVDVATMLIVPAALGIAVLLACYVPARRAARVDPLESLRSL